MIRSWHTSYGSFHRVVFFRGAFLSQVGKNKCHIVDTFWQTETGGHVMLPLAGVTPTKPGSCSFPFFGIEVRQFQISSLMRSAS